MKKAIATFCLIGSTLALSACDTTSTGNAETAVPYTTERTASSMQKTTPAATPQTMTPAEPMFKKAQTK